MKRSELKNGMIVETRKGEKGLIVKDNCYGEDAVIFHEHSWTSLNGFDEDLTWRGAGGDKTDFTKTVDIMKVYKPDLPTGFLGRTNKFTSFAPIWERKDKKLTKNEWVAQNFKNTPDVKVSYVNFEEIDRNYQEYLDNYNKTNS